MNLPELTLCVDAWIIQDGNYGEFHRGDSLTCAIEFYGELRASAQRRAAITHLKENLYRVCAQVVFSAPHAWAIDFGLGAFQECPPPAGAANGAWFEGELELAIDPFFYREYLYKAPGMPDLFNTWQIGAVARNDTPWVKAPNGNVYVRDVARSQWTPVEHTDAWHDDDGRSAYLLQLRRA
ncbi:hypothetical protein [Pseudomonas sp. NPDC007930]|uniref:hypothetical protein n=1 Tax=Pseudomonas sp. NPDC007930 TaxID=3364417 RepID=UPI0036E5F0B0